MTFSLNDFTPTAAIIGAGGERRGRTGFEGNRLETLILDMPIGVCLTQVKQAAKWFRGRGEKKTTLHAIKGPCDFTGCFVPSGRAIVLDAKESKDPERLKTSEDHLPEVQRLELLRYGEARAVAGVLAMRTTDDSLFWVSWRLLRARRPSIAWSEMYAIGSAKVAIRWAAIEAAEAAPQRL